MDWWKNPNNWKQLPLGFWIFVASIVLGFSYAVSHMAGCEKEVQKARYEYLEKSNSSFWDAKERK